MSGMLVSYFYIYFNAMKALHVYYVRDHSGTRGNLLKSIFIFKKCTKSIIRPAEGRHSLLWMYLACYTKYRLVVYPKMQQILKA